MGNTGHGIAETKEVLDAVGALSALLVEHLRDGFAPGSDILAIGTALVTRSDVRAALMRAAEGISKVPDELSDIDAFEGLALAQMAIDNAKRVISALKAQ